MAAKSNKTLFFVISFVFALIAAGGVGITIASLNAKTSYWVVAQDIAPRTRITSQMLIEKEARAGSEPESALTAAQVDSNEVYAKYALRPGDILTPSNAGQLTSLDAGLPDDFSLSSFTVPATSGSLGVAKRGDHIDIYAFTDTNGIKETRLVLQNVLVVDSVSQLQDVDARAVGGGRGAQDASEAVDPTKQRQLSKVSTIYQVALSRDETAIMAHLTNNANNKLFVALSPKAGAGAPYPTPANDEVVYNSGKTDSSQGTDPTFGVKEKPAEKPAE